jgi:pilus assembly protein Flp/PilA
VELKSTRQRQTNKLLPAGREGSSLQFLQRKESIMFKKFLKDETGLELSEYAVAAALVALAAVAAFQLLGTNIGSRINTLAGWIK